ncbi:MAG: 3'-5' exonuclease [Lachnospiraceae bacterium]|nr:3'-5' exonuclease [Lachnospiraceae bacterium]
MIKDYVALDLETTGLNPKTDKIIEIGVVRVREGIVRETFSTFVNPARGLTAKTKELTGIEEEDLKTAPYIEDILDDLLLFIGNDHLLGHNILFDFSFLKRVVVNRKKSFDKEGIDTLRIARRFLTDLESRNLGFLCKYYGIELAAHRALNDAVASHMLYERLCQEFYAKEADSFMPKKLVYQVKREGPITPRQKEHFGKLADKYSLTLTSDGILQLREDDIEIFGEQYIDIHKLTKNEASRFIDRLLARYGR